MAYIRLADNYRLRGFNDILYAIINKNNGSVEVLDKNIYYILALCDGSIDMDMVFLTKTQREILQNFMDKKLVVCSPHSDPILPIQKYKKADNNFLRSVHWSVTGNCNLRCRHCYMSAPDYKYKDLNTESCLEIIDQMEQANVSSVSITGGEPFVRRDIWQLLEYLCDKGIAVTEVYTNGLLLTDEVLGRIKKIVQPPRFVLSFDGVNGHDWLRGREGAEEATVNAIRLLKQHGFEVMIETAVYEKNIETLLETYTLLKELDIDFWKTSLIFQAGKWKEQLCRTIEVPELYQAYLHLIAKYMEDDAPFFLQLDGFFACARNQEEQWFSPYKKKTVPFREGQELCCGTCRVHPYLLPDGTLLPCATMTDSPIERHMPNLKDISLSQIYRDPTHPFFKIANMRTGEILESNSDCAICAYNMECQGGCRAMSLVEDRGLYGHSGVLCTFFKGGYEIKIDQTVKKARKGGMKMNSREALENLMKKDPTVEQELRKIAELPETEALDALHQFEQKHDIQLNPEDFEQQDEELKDQELGKVAGGVDPLSVFTVITGVLGLFPTSTGRGTDKGTSRFK